MAFNIKNKWDFIIEFEQHLKILGCDQDIIFEVMIEDSDLRPILEDIATTTAIRDIHNS